MREIIENQIKQTSNDDQSKAEDFQVLNLGLTSHCWQLALHRLNAGRNFKISVSIVDQELILVLITEKKPHHSVEFKRRLTPNEMDALPPKINEILSEQGDIHITGAEGMHLASSGYPRPYTSEHMFLIIGYNMCGLASYRQPRNDAGQQFTDLISGMHGSQVRTEQTAVSLSMRNVLWFKTTFNATHGFSVEELARLEITTFPKAKKLLASAGRSKPQGDLILYFGENSCLAEGVNGAGAETLELQNATSLRDLETYQSDIVGEEYLKATFNYPAIYATLMSTAKGFSSPDTCMNYGLDINQTPFIEVGYSTYGVETACRVKFTMRGTLVETSELPNDSVTVLNLKSKTTVQATVQPEASLVVEQETSTVPIQPIVPVLGSEATTLVNQWRDAYIAYNTARGLSIRSGHPLEYFNAFMMLQIEQGNEIEEAHYELYNSLK